MISRKILGVRIDDVTMDEAVATIEALITDGQPHQVTTVNPEFIMQARADHAFRRVINHSDLAVPDGIGLILMGKLTGRPFHERVAGVDLIHALAKVAVKKGWSFFLLGAKEGVAAKAAEELQNHYPGVQINGTLSSRPGEQDNETICKIVETANPTILLVGYGAPLQDLWISRNQTELKIPLAIGVGGTFDFIAGVAKKGTTLDTGDRNGVVLAINPRTMALETHVGLAQICNFSFRRRNRPR